MTKKRNTKKKYGGQSAFEMGMASYIRHLLDYTDGGGNWIVDLDEFTLPDGMQPSARWITNRIIHNYQKDSEGSNFFGKRFEYSPKAVDFLEAILRQIKHYFNDKNVDEKGVEEGIYDRDLFNSYVNDAIKIIESKKAETAETSSKVSLASTNRFDGLPVETRARVVKEPKVSMTPAVLTQMVDDRTRELREKSISDNITISNLNSKVGELAKQTDILSRKLKETEEQNKKMNDELKELRPVVPKRKPEIVLKPEVVAEAVKPEVVLKPEIVLKPEVMVEVKNPEVLPPPPPSKKSSTEVLPPMSEAEKAEAEKKALMDKKRAEIVAKVAEGRKQQEEQEKIKSAMSLLNAPPPPRKTRQDVLKSLLQPPSGFTEDEIEKIAEKIHLEPVGVHILVNMTSKSDDKEYAVNLENILVNKMIPGDIENKIERLLESVEIKEGTETIDMFKSIMNFIMKTWLTNLWKIDETSINTYKIESFEKNIKLFESMLTELDNYKKKPNSENDTRVRNIINEHLNQSKVDMFNNCIDHNWGVFSLLFLLDNKKKYTEFFNNMEFYEKNTKLGDKGIYPIKTIISFMNNDLYNSFSANIIEIFNAIDKIIDMMDIYFSNPNPKTQPDIKKFNIIYSRFIENSIMSSIFLIFDSYKGKDGKQLMERLVTLSDKFKNKIKKWDKNLSEKEKENTYYQEYMLFILTFSYSIIKMITYSLIPVELRTILETYQIPSGEPPGEPPGGGFMLTTGKNKKKGGRRRTHKKHYRK